MNFLLCSPQEISQNMGISRVLIEIQKELNRTGHLCDLIGPNEIGCTISYNTTNTYLQHYSELLKQYILKHGHKYEVIDVDHEFLPYTRSEFSSNFLLVARSVLLVQHLNFITFPRRHNLQFFMGQLFNSYSRKCELNARIISANKTLQCVDLINVPNEKDKELLIKSGYKANKIVVIPYGLSPQIVELFKSTTSDLPENSKICFVGTFDYRKGAMHFAKFLKIVNQSIPNVSLKLIGCKGMFQTEHDILQFFPLNLQSRVEVILKFDREFIVDQIKDCRLGIFPSYLEGFPFGILEMMMANIPVLAFDTPGAGMMVSSEDLVSAGEIELLAQKAITLLNNESLLKAKRKEVKESVLKFTWEEVSKKTLLSYQSKIKELKA